SWINLVERWFALLTEKQIRRGIFRSTRELETTIRNYIDTHNEHPKPFIWTKTADEILASVARFCKRTLVPGHSRLGTKKPYIPLNPRESVTGPKDKRYDTIHGRSYLARREPKQRRILDFPQLCNDSFRDSK